MSALQHKVMPDLVQFYGHFKQDYVMREVLGGFFQIFLGAFSAFISLIG